MHRVDFDRIVDKFSEAVANFASPIALSPEIRAKRQLTLLTIIASVPILLGFAVFVALRYDFYLALALFALAAVATSSFIVGRHTVNVDILYRFNVAFIGLIFLYLVFTSAKMPHRVLWAYIFPLEAFYLLGRREGVIYNLVYLAMAGVLIFGQDLYYGKAYLEPVFKVEFLISLSLIVLIAYFFETVRMKYQKGVTDRQNSLERANTRLQQEVITRKEMEQRALETLHNLKTTQSQLVQSAKMASLGQLAAGVGHELNQPLTIVLGNAQIIKQKTRLGGALSAEEMKRFDLIRTSAKRMMDIVSHLKTFSRQSKGTFLPVVVNDIIEDCSFLVREQLKEHGISVKKRLGRKLPLILGNRNQLEQVLLNLLINSKDAIQAERQNRKHPRFIEIISSISQNNPSRLNILIKDNGPGIAKQVVELIFEPFFTTKAVGEGTGLGLSISYGIIKDHNGSIAVAQTGPDGTTFKIQLPVLKA